MKDRKAESESRVSSLGLTGESMISEWMLRSHRSMTFLNYLFAVALLFIITFFFCSLPAFAAEKWAGVDEVVVEKIAKDHGREKKEPFINTDQGDLLLFVFLMAGTIGGFAAGYYWRILMVERVPKVNKEES